MSCILQIQLTLLTKYGKKEVILKENWHLYDYLYDLGKITVRRVDELVWQQFMHG